MSCDTHRLGCKMGLLNKLTGMKLEYPLHECRFSIWYENGEILLQNWDILYKYTDTLAPFYIKRAKKKNSYFVNAQSSVYIN